MIPAASAGSQLVCADCEKVLYRIVKDIPVGELITATAVQAVEGAEPVTGLPIACPDHGAGHVVVVRADEIKAKAALAEALALLASTEDVEWRADVKDFLREQGATAA